MKDTVYVANRPLRNVGISQVSMDEVDVAENLRARLSAVNLVDKAINNPDFMAIVEQLSAEMSANESGTSGNEISGHTLLAFASAAGARALFRSRVTSDAV
jgi:hypothetical protein